MKKLNTIKLPVCTPALISDATDVFTGYLDLDFTKWGLDTYPKSKEMSVDVHELTKDMTFKDMFPTPETMWLTQGQVIQICKNHKEELQQNGYNNFFLLKKGDDFFVASVGVVGDGRLEAGLSEFRFGLVWRGVCGRRVFSSHGTMPLDTGTLPLSPSETLEQAIKVVKSNGYKVIKEF